MSSATPAPSYMYSTIRTLIFGGFCHDSRIQQQKKSAYENIKDLLENATYEHISSNEIDDLCNDVRGYYSEDSQMLQMLRTAKSRINNNTLKQKMECSIAF
jgi:hypothetical protein